MPERQGPRYIWFKLLLVIGGLLGVLLLVQSVFSYRYVSERLLVEELLRDAGRQTAFLARHAWQMKVREPEALAALFSEIVAEQEPIAWLRIRDRNGKVLAEVGQPVGELLPVDTLENRDLSARVYQVRGRGAERVLVTVRGLRYQFRPPRSGQEALRAGLPGVVAPPPGEAPRGSRTGPGRGQQSKVLEIALYWNSADTESIGVLRNNLILQVSAAVALLVAMAFLGLRFRNYVRGKQLEQQLELARRVQQDLLPAGRPSCGDLDFAAACDPAWQVGGDFYDVFPADRNRVAMLLGDVSGKGLPAALLMGLLHGAVRSSHWFGDGTVHEEASERLNQLLCLRTSVEMFASLFWCYYDPDTQRLRYVNAGHLPPFVASPNGDGTPKLSRLEEGGPVLGVIPVARYHQGEVEFHPGDLMVLYSDGVVEAANAAEEEFGEERLASIIRENWSRPSIEIRDEIMRQVQAFVGREQVQDDLTLLVVRAGVPAAGQSEVEAGSQA